MSQVQLFSTGQGSRERHSVKICPNCKSTELKYKNGGEGKFFAWCRDCGWFGSKKCLEERDQNRYERGR